MKNQLMYPNAGKAILTLLLCSSLISGCDKESNDEDTETYEETVTVGPEHYTITGSLTGAPGLILETYNSSPDGTLAILDEKGKAISYQLPGENVGNFQRWVINNKVRYTYFRTEGNTLLEGVSTTSIGYYYICDSALNVIKKVKQLDNGSINTSIQDKIDQHAFILLDDDHYILQTYYLATPTNIPAALNPASGVIVVDNIIQEIKNDAVIWQWEGTRFPELYSTSVEYNDFSDASTPKDYMHLNSMYIDPKDNNLICSFRHLNQILKLDRTTGEIVWRLGGTNSDFALTSDQKFLRQHYAHLLSDNNTIIMLDNGDATERPYSRVVELTLDETSKTISSSKTYKIPDNFIQFAGSVEKHDDAYFIGGGSASYTLEINYNTNEVLLRLAHTYGGYRAIKYYY